MKRLLVLAALSLLLLAMGKKPQGKILYEGGVKDGPFESFEIVELEGKHELHLSKGKETCKFPLGTWNTKDVRAWFDGAKMGGCKVVEVLRASGEIGPQGGSIRLLGGKDPVDLVLVDVTKAQ